MSRLALPVLVCACGPRVEVRAVEVPHNALAVDIELLADTPVTAEVTCTPLDGEDDLRSATATQANEALLLPVWGLRHDTDWDCVVQADRNGRVLQRRIEWTPDPLPFGVGGYTVEGEATGWTWISAWNNNQAHPNTRAELVDTQGRVRGYRFLDYPVAEGLDVEVVGENLLFGGGPDLAPTWFDPSGFELKRLGEPPWPGRYHHHASAVDGGVLTLVDVDNTDGATTWIGAGIVWFDELGSPVWTWNSQDAVDTGGLPSADEGADPYHVNSATWLEDSLGPAVWVSAAGLNQLLRIDRDTLEITHRLGVDGDFSLSDGEWFTFQHDPEWHWPRVLIHDNGTTQSRVLILEVDLEARTAQPVDSWTEDDWYEPLFGDADLLEDDGILVSRGRCFEACPDLPERQSQIVELTADRQVRWRLTAPDGSRGFYRAERSAY